MGPLLLTILFTLFTLPFIALLIELNGSIELPAFLRNAESYFRENEVRANLWSSQILSFTEPGDLLVAMLVIAVMPGIAEELFFRGLVQLPLQNGLKNKHVAIFLTAIIFSCLHFQFFSIIPRIVFGILFGYLFLWSGNVWYSCWAHVTNNLVGVLGAYFFALEAGSSTVRSMTSITFWLPSVVLSALIVLLLKRCLMTNEKVLES